MGFWGLKTRLWKIGRVSMLFEPRDLWIFYFHGKDAGYLCIIPMFPLRIEWVPRAADVYQSVGVDIFAERSPHAEPPGDPELPEPGPR